MNPTKILADQTVAVLRLFGDIDRGEADRLLSMYAPWLRMREKSVEAAEELRSLVLDRFPAAEPPSVPGLDWLPSAAEVASYTAAVTESLAVPAPVKAVQS